jgi:hypothetical protein
MAGDTIVRRMAGRALSAIHIHCEGMAKELPTAGMTLGFFALVTVDTLILSMTQKAL